MKATKTLKFINLIRVQDLFYCQKKLYTKTKEQPGKVKMTETVPTLRFTNKIQKILCRLREEKKFTDKEYLKIYPSDPIPPQLNNTVEAHKPRRTVT